ncbi:aldo/keto reductase [Microbacterium pseudoresistens]|uniref:Diketogulonate reductase-like aldo/keto reductase n=1 Tax=Microbacterium pseudoresistens TaxID=640634 RepID=A0A7Y9EX35_9MICO|nr:aldo/keto reductase [Microbacterium pseudoresistens]NYD55558.1 diketogulonate reductase-like aldo/keto reductase [Microbacterium pseudoresistens]
MSARDPFIAHNGFTLPAQGLGTYRFWGESGADAVRAGIESGYRLVDSAFNYENEGAVGWGVSGAAVDRSEIIVTTKLAGRHHGAERARTAIEESRFRLGVDAIDLVLIHWPNPGVDKYVEAWEALIAARENGTVRQIGVSNFLPEHLERIESVTGVRPVVNQIELHPYFPQEDQLAYDLEHGIVTEAWSPLGRAGDVLNEPAVTAIADARGITPAQAVLAWHATRGSVAIPKAADPAHQAANLAAAEIRLTDDEVASITALGRPDGRLFDADPRTHEEQ